MEFPKYKYAPDGGHVLVHSREQELQLEEHYKDSPAEHGIITHPSVDQVYETAAEDAGLVGSSAYEVTDAKTNLMPGIEDVVVVNLSAPAAPVVESKPVPAKSAAKKKAK